MLGAFTVTIGLAGLVYGFIQSAESGWSDPRVIGSMIVGIAAFVLFAVIERRISAPMISFELFKSRSFTGANLFTLLLYSALGIFFFIYPLNLIQIQKYSATATGAASVPMIVLMFLLSRWSGGLVSHYGPRIPLIVGPLIAAAGFLLFARPSFGGNYWTTFFPAFVVLGLGMAVTVAPLTVVVMGSIGQDRAGTASGINNAVARVAGVLAIAILGGAMVQAFGHDLHKSLTAINLDPAVARDLQSNRVKLGALQVPANVDANTAANVQDAISRSFVYAFRWMVAICAALAVASAAVALLMISTSAKPSASASS